MRTVALKWLFHILPLWIPVKSFTVSYKNRECRALFFLLFILFIFQIMAANIHAESRDKFIVLYSNWDWELESNRKDLRYSNPILIKTKFVSHWYKFQILSKIIPFSIYHKLMSSLYFTHSSKSRSDPWEFSFLEQLS